MTFYEWLMQQIERDDPIGDLARDAKSDSTAPRDSGLYRWDVHLSAHQACPEAHRALLDT